MGNPKQKWTAEEELALRAGIDKHGAGKWRTIQKDPEFSIVLATRSNVDLKVRIILSRVTLFRSLKIRVLNVFCSVFRALF
jgi:hypothetical protein